MELQGRGNIHIHQVVQIQDRGRIYVDQQPMCIEGVTVHSVLQLVI